ncbi:MAG: CRISPR-associated helicase Cas3' [Thermoguttaceae bacterium]
MTNQLWAKKPEHETSTRSDNACLLSHLKLTYAAAKVLLDKTAESQMAFLGLVVPEEYRLRFRRIVLLAAAIHDLGKANNHFQALVCGKQDSQSIRHEWVLYLLLRFSPLGKWFADALSVETRENDFTFVVWAVTGHHRKEEGEETNEHPGDLRLLSNHPDFAACLDWLASLEELALPPRPDEIASLVDGSICVSRKKSINLSDVLAKPGRSVEIGLYASKVEPDNEFSDSDMKLMAAVRSTVMAADVVASALAERDFLITDDETTETAVRKWVDETLGTLPMREQYQQIVSLQQQKIATTTSNDSSSDNIAQQRSAFQHKVATSESRVTLVTAGCGSGKTLAAWQWAENNCRPDGNRLFFCYPTTGTATEGFLDYLIDDDNKLGDLRHSRANVDFLLHERLRRLPPDDTNDANEVIRSLDLWRTGIVCCTVDTVLRFLVSDYSGHLSFPAFTQGIFVFDEIHSYDETLFGYLIKFLEIARGAKILLMTASLPKARLEEIKRVLRKQQNTLNVVTGPAHWEEVRRYRVLQYSDSFDEAMSRYRADEKVLWICNTVDRAIQTADKITEQMNDGTRPIVYHSHFKYVDRSKRHQKCVAAFRRTGGAICVTTQVAEMSLDIDADFLVTEAAPIPAMIQRLGRLNRRAVCDNPKPFVVLEPPPNSRGERLPYSLKDWGEWFAQTNDWLARLGSESISQADLTTQWEQIASETPKLKSKANAQWLDAGPWMTHGPLRDISTGCSVLLDEDIAAVKHGGRAEYIRLVIPMSNPPRGLEEHLRKHKHPIYGCYLLTNGRGIQYDQYLGGRWGDFADVSPSTQDGVHTIKPAEIY